MSELFETPNKVRGFEFVTDKRKLTGEPLMRLPESAYEDSAGYDFFAPYDVAIEPGKKVLIWTDVKAYMQPREWLFVDVRSSYGIKKDLMLANTIAVVDSDYYNNEDNEGNIGICLRNIGDVVVEFKAGEAYAQGLFLPYLKSDNGNSTKKRSGGLGSSDQSRKL